MLEGHDSQFFIRVPPTVILSSGQIAQTIPLNSKSPQLQSNGKVTAYYVHMKTMLGGQQLADRFEVIPPLMVSKHLYSTKKPGLPPRPRTPGGKPHLRPALLLLGDGGHPGW